MDAPCAPIFGGPSEEANRMYSCGMNNQCDAGVLDFT